jgi:uncharacterized membrane protein
MFLKWKESSVLSEILIIILFVLQAVVMGSTLYLAAKFLDWSRSRPLRGAKSAVFNFLVVGVATVIAFLLLLDIELVELYGTLKEGALIILEASDIAIVIMVSVLLIVVFQLLKRIRQQPTQDGCDNM